MPEPLTQADLRRLYFRVEGRDVNAVDATDAEFDSWARSSMPVMGQGASWPVSERLDFCNWFQNFRVLYLIPEEDAPHA